MVLTSGVDEKLDFGQLQGVAALAAPILAYKPKPLNLNQTWPSSAKAAAAVGPLCAGSRLDIARFGQTVSLLLPGSRSRTAALNSGSGRVITDAADSRFSTDALDRVASLV